MASGQSVSSNQQQIANADGESPYLRALGNVLLHCNQQSGKNARVFVDQIKSELSTEAENRASIGRVGVARAPTTGQSVIKQEVNAAAADYEFTSESESMEELPKIELQQSDFDARTVRVQSQMNLKNSFDRKCKHGVQMFELIDVKIEFTAEDYRTLLTFKTFSDRVRPLIIQANPKGAEAKISGLVQAKWSRFEEIQDNLPLSRFLPKKFKKN